MNEVYVFALTGETVPPFTIDGHLIQFLEARGMYAAVERSVDRPVVSEATLRTQHDIVVALSERIPDVLPARFGAWLQPRELQDFVAARERVVREALDLVRGRVQMTVRLPRMHAAGKALPAVVASGTAYLEQKRQASRHVSSEATALADSVRDLVAAERVVPETDLKGASVYHLIERTRIPDYRARVSVRLPPDATITGPWPAFAFVPDLWP